MAEYNPSKIIKGGNTYNFRDTTKIPLAGSNEISGSLIPSTDGTVNLGSPSYQWNNAYIKSLTINGVAWGLDQENRWTNLNIYTREIRINGDRYAYIAPMWLGPASGISFLVQDASKLFVFGQQTTDANNRPCYDATKGYLVIRTGEKNGETVLDFEPHAANAILGTSTNKWKSFNGLNPGALSLPSNSYVNVDTTDWDLTCSNGQLGSFTPTADGWLMLSVANSGTNEVNFWIIGGTLRINNKSTINTVNNENFNMITIPVKKDKTYNIFGNASEYVAGRSIAYCRFMPCQGNV